MDDFEKYTDAELLFVYGTIKKEYKQAYAKQKACEEEIDRRYSVKMQKAIASHGLNGTYEQLEEENKKPFTLEIK